MVKTIVSRCWKQVLGAEMFELLLKSPLAQSLLSYRFDVPFENDEKENLEQLTAMLERNFSIHQQRYGRKNLSPYLTRHC